MGAVALSEKVAGLYNEFADNFRSNNDEAVRRVYRELLAAGRPRAEIVDEAMRLGTAAQATFGIDFLVADDRARPAKKQKGSVPDQTFDRIHQLQAIINVNPDESRQKPQGTAVTFPTIQPSRTIKARTFLFPVAELSERDQKQPAAERVSEDFCCKDAVGRETDHRPTLVLKSRNMRLWLTAILTLAVVSGSVLGVLRVGSTAEKIAAISALSDSVRAATEDSVSVSNPSTSAPVTEAVASASDQTQLIEALAANPGQSDVKGSKRPILSSAALLKPPELAAENPKGSPTSLRAAYSDGAAGVPVIVGRGMAAVQPDAAVARLQERSAPALADLAPATPAAPISRFSAFPLPAVEISVLLIRGDSMFETGDIVSARLFYERAAVAGSGQAALRLGESFDPHFLEQAHVRGVRDDLSAAAFWYQRAHELGMDEAKILLGSLRDK